MKVLIISSCDSINSIMDQIDSTDSNLIIVEGEKRQLYIMWDKRKYSIYNKV